MNIHSGLSFRRFPAIRSGFAEISFVFVEWDAGGASRRLYCGQKRENVRKKK
ncbi:hypothetical protein CLOSTASPAR_03291 [[Clostridium] asparagiforme DSM 15981]|uniref:Uncharacterized protein n=1 Tax=[Clostridium] asparagiforme DSM 15981 TaxID=518636 RepID=C0D202_9FIRM|nr:hypothetical protein CLOSTASPAR_03291 [[Clostridium] asparagiforme DSM 15981]